MESGPLSEKEFKKVGEKFVLFLHVTSRVKTDADQDLLSKKGGTGFPYLVWMNEAGDVITKQGGRKTADILETGGKVNAYFEIKAKGEKGDKKAKIDALLHEMSFGMKKFDDGKAELDKLGTLSEDQTAWLKKIEFNATVQEIIDGVGRDKNKMIAAGEKFNGMVEKGTVPEPDSQVFDAFYIFILNWAESDKNASAFEKALGPLKEKYKDNKNAKRFFDQKDKILEQLKSDG